jgi:hypothetical protein
MIAFGAVSMQRGADKQHVSDRRDYHHEDGDDGLVDRSRAEKRSARHIPRKIGALCARAVTHALASR